MAENKTKATKVSVESFLEKVQNPQRKEDAYKLIEMMKDITGEKPVMWGPSIIGFGSYHYKYASGREGDMPRAAFSPRKDSQVIYLLEVFKEKEGLIKKLGKCTTSKGCLYIKKLEDVDMEVLKDLIRIGVERLED